MRKLIVPLLFGLLGCAVLTGFGVWQLQRLAWKENLLAEIGARVVEAPGPLPSTPDPEADLFRPVGLAGQTRGDLIRIFGTWTGFGAGERIVSAFESENGRKILVDLGAVVPQAAVDLAAETIAIDGHLAWPEETNFSTPDPDGALWFARDVSAMAEALGTEPVLLVAARVDPPFEGVRPLPISTEGIPNNHLGYAIQWFGLALVWAGMTAFFLWRMTRRTG